MFAYMVINFIKKFTQNLTKKLYIKYKIFKLSSFIMTTVKLFVQFYYAIPIYESLPDNNTRHMVLNDKCTHTQFVCNAK